MSNNYKDSLNLFYKELILSKDEKNIDSLKSKIFFWSKKLIQDKGAIKNTIDSLKGINFIESENKELYIITFDYFDSKKNLNYAGLIIQKAQNNIFTTQLVDKGFPDKKAENTVSNPENWIGCRYYKIIQLEKKKFLLLGADFRNKSISRKWIDVLKINKDNSMIFGESIFEGLQIKRYILQYNNQISTSLKYDSKTRRIIFDHLIPQRKELKNQFQFYVPDLSFDAFELKNGKLKFLSDVDARNEEK